MRVFIDSDVLLDFFLNREPFAEASSMLLARCEDRSVVGYTSPLVLSNIHYLLRQKTTTEKVKKCLHYLVDHLRIVSMDRETVLAAIHSDFSDFEDALQYGAVITDKTIQCIVTRNIKDYRKSALPVHTPEGALALVRQQG